MPEPTSLALVNCQIYTGGAVLTDHAVVMRQGTIDSTPPVDQLPPGVDVVDLDGCDVAPGFIDLQVNGGGCVLFNDDPTPATLVQIRDAHLRGGTTDLLPTFITGSFDAMSAAATSVNHCLKEGVDGILGIHFEGPMLNPSKAGVHDVGFIRHGPTDELASMYSSVEGGYTVVTLAPEVVPPGFVRRLCAAGVRVSAGHTNATFAQMMTAFDEGLSCGGTHLWNAMSPMTSREPGAVGALLWDDRAWYGIIGDGAHVDMNTLALSVKSKAVGQAFLVSDALNPVGAPGATSFWLGSSHVQVVDGVCITDGGTLAGSCCDLAAGVRNCVEGAGISKDEALRMATMYPARFLGADDRLGWIRSGYAARLVVLDNRIRVTATIVDGEMKTIVPGIGGHIG